MSEKKSGKPGADIRKFFSITPKKEPTASVDADLCKNSSVSSTTMPQPTMDDVGNAVKNHDISALTNDTSRAVSQAATMKSKSTTVSASPAPASMSSMYDDDDEPLAKPVKRAKNIIDDDSDAGPVRRPAAKKRKFDASDSEASDPGSSSESESDSDGYARESDEEAAPVSRKGAKTKPGAPTKPKAPAKATAKSVISPAKPVAAARAVDDEASGDEADDMLSPGPATLSSSDYTLPAFVLPENIMDAKRRRPDHPDYDPRTLYVSETELKKMTPAQRQFWEIKSTNMDVVLCFKVGKFYELFDLDAEVGIRELNLLKMNGDRLHVGFPEATFSKYAEVLVKRGYKVGRVEQTQTPKQLQEANAKAGKGQKSSVVKREMCQILTKATLTDGGLVGSDDAAFLLSITEQPLVEHRGNEPDTRSTAPNKLTATTAMARVRSAAAETFVKLEYEERAVRVGVCLADTATGRLYVCSFVDDVHRAQLKTLLAQTRPQEVLFPRRALTAATRAALASELPHTTVLTELTPGTEYWDAERTIAQVLAAGYYADEAGRVAWPSALQPHVARVEAGATDEDDDAAHSQVLLSAFGAVVCYLRRLLLDREVLPLRAVDEYTAAASASFTHMHLDAQSLSNLEVLVNQEGGREGTLLAHLDHCCTPFGRRLLRQWVSRPLGNVGAINERLDAVEALMDATDTVREVRALLRKVPDVERLLSRVKANGVKKEQTAVMYENVGKGQVEVFLRTMSGFKSALAAVQVMRNAALEAPLLQRVVGLQGGDVPAQVEAEGEDEDAEAGDAFSRIRAMLGEFDAAFDHAQALRDGHIIPQDGVVPAFDDARARVRECERALDAYLQEQRGVWGREVCYFHRAKETYQLEIPISVLSKGRLGSEYDQCSSTKKVRRFYTPRLRTLIDALDDATEHKTTLLQDVTRQVFAKFAHDYALWAGAMRAVAELDCLLSLAAVSAAQTPSCRPQLVEPSSARGPFLDVVGGVHPMAGASAFASGSGDSAAAGRGFIPNDTAMGTAAHPARVLLVSGPNMGGKSTLLRQVCLLVLMAQVGCFVTAEACTLTPADAVFTRLGAADRIMQGQSTFLVELEETSAILRRATQHSLVIMDELGRGTATFDGSALAHGVLQFLVGQLGSRALFATHYHSLLEEAKADPRMRRCHMACVVGRGRRGGADGEAKDEDGWQREEEEGDARVTFLYKLVEGASEKSFGLNVARLAGIPSGVVRRAREMGRKLELCMTRTSNTMQGVEDIRALARAVVEAAKRGDKAAVMTLKGQWQQQVRA